MHAETYIYSCKHSEHRLTSARPAISQQLETRTTFTVETSHCVETCPSNAVSWFNAFIDICNMSKSQFCKIA